MPELPEVETVVRQLSRELVGAKFIEVYVNLPKMLKNCTVGQLRRFALNSRIRALKRRAKIILIEFSNGYMAAIHLKMTGQLIFRKKRRISGGGHPIKNGTLNLPNKYSHIYFELSNGGYLFFNDLRQFGYLQLIKPGLVEDFFRDLKLGPEPLERSFSFEIFYSLLKKRKSRKIKPLLMDQSFISGVGNIYATEACFYAGLNPAKKAGEINKEEARQLYRSLIKILKKAVLDRGSSPDTYVDAYGNPGNYVPKLRVYGREGNKCLRCGAVIKSIRLNGRSTAYCPVCQNSQA